MDLTAIALRDSPDLAKIAGRVSDSGEGRWTVTAAIEESVPVPVLSAALFERFSSRGEADFADKLLSAMRFEFGALCCAKPPRRGYTKLQYSSRVLLASALVLAVPPLNNLRCRAWLYGVHGELLRSSLISRRQM